MECFAAPFLKKIAGVARLEQRGTPHRLTSKIIGEPFSRSIVGGQMDSSCCRGDGRVLCVSIGTIILIILVLVMLGGFSGMGGGRFYGTGNYGGGGLGLIVMILLILVVLGRI